MESVAVVRGWEGVVSRSLRWCSFPVLGCEVEWLGEKVKVCLPRWSGVNGTLSGSHGKQGVNGAGSADAPLRRKHKRWRAGFFLLLKPGLSHQGLCTQWGDRNAALLQHLHSKAACSDILKRPTQAFKIARNKKYNVLFFGNNRFVGIWRWIWHNFLTDLTRMIKGILSGLTFFLNIKCICKYDTKSELKWFLLFFCFTVIFCKNSEIRLNYDAIFDSIHQV